MIQTFRRRAFLKLATVFALTAPLTATASVDAWKNDVRPIRIIVAFTAGGYTDVIGRLLAARLSQNLGRNVIVENRPGANGVIGTVAAARSQPDGNTLLLAAPGHVTNLLIVPDIQYHPQRDFTPIAKVATLPNVLVVPPNSPYDTLQSLLDDAGTQSGALTYASGGVGSSNHLAMEQLLQMAGVSLRHIPYKGSSQAETDVAGGHVHAMFSGAGSAVTQVRGGNLRPLAVSSPTRIPSLPDVPTVSEAGVENYEFSSWLGLFAPANTPDEIAERLNAEVNAVLANPEVGERLAELGVDEFQPNSLAEFAQFLEDEIKLQTELVEAIGGLK